MYNMLTKVWLQSYQKQSNVIEKDVSTLPFFSKDLSFLQFYLKNNNDWCLNMDEFVRYKS